MGTSMIYILGATLTITWIAFFILGGYLLMLPIFDENLSRWKESSAGLIIIILCFAFMFWAIDNEDNAEHCGPGTVYRESSHYNPATKTMHINWWCEAK